MKNEIYLFETQGTSMHPEIKSSSGIIVKKVHPSFIGIFDIVVYKKNSKFFAHRVLWKTKKFFFVKGNAFSPLEKVKVDNVFGKVIFICKDKKFLTTNKLKALYFLFISPIILLLWKIKNSGYQNSRNSC